VHAAAAHVPQAPLMACPAPSSPRARLSSQGQANAWVRAMEGGSGLRVLRPGDPTFQRTMESCIRTGTPVLVEDVGVALDPALEPVLQVRPLPAGPAQRAPASTGGAASSVAAGGAGRAAAARARHRTPRALLGRRACLDLQPPAA
jgi:hypothetical protein